MDHFIGFDHLLRLLLGREKVLSVYGPTGIIDRLEHKLAAYTWNLVQNYTNNFEITAYEVKPDIITRAKFICREGFKRNPIADTQAFNGVLLDEASFSVKTAILDHLLPSLAFCLTEKIHLNINKVRLAELGLPAGTWLTELKNWVLEKRDEQQPFRVQYKVNGQTECQTFPFGKLKHKLVSTSPGEKIAYIADAVYSPENVQKILELADAADYFFCEAAFMDKDLEHASRTYHLTAKQAGELAKQAGVRRFIPFHFSPRYDDNPEQLTQEAHNAFTDLKCAKK